MGWFSGGGSGAGGAGVGAASASGAATSPPRAASGRTQALDALIEEAWFDSARGGAPDISEMTLPVRVAMGLGWRHEVRPRLRARRRRRLAREPSGDGCTALPFSRRGRTPAPLHPPTPPPTQRELVGTSDDDEALDTAWQQMPAEGAAQGRGRKAARGEGAAAPQGAEPG
jgi:hypothetical protein